jgi:hypothetical protein
MRFHMLTLGACTSLAILPSTVQANDGMISFLACPEYRPANGGCWTATYNGQDYALLNSENGLAPQLRHEILVEGVPLGADAGSVCGGQPFAQLWLSVMPELSPECNTVLPPVPGLAPPANPINEDMLAMLQFQLAAPPPPYATTEFLVGFDFNHAFLAKRMEIPAELAARYAIAADAREVILEAGYGSTLLSNGEVLVEDRAILDRRIDLIMTAFADIGFPVERIRIAEIPTSPGEGPLARQMKITIVP